MEITIVSKTCIYLFFFFITINNLHAQCDSLNFSICKSCKSYLKKDIYINDECIKTNEHKLFTVGNLTFKRKKYSSIFNFN